MLRQSIAIHCGTYACILYCESKIRTSLMWICAAFFFSCVQYYIITNLYLPLDKKAQCKMVRDNPNNIFHR